MTAGAFPISLDVGEVEDLAGEEQVQARAQALREELGSPEHVLLGVDRLDYTKGIRHRLKAWSELLEDGDVTPEHAVFIQVATPSRERVTAYQALREEIELTVGHMNGEFGRIGLPAVHYLHSTYDRRELVAAYLAADVMVVTPLRDGMNLVAKEYVTVQHARRGSGALVLSEFTGAAAELREAVPCNPFDVEGLSYRIEHALGLPASTRRTALATMGRRIRGHDVHRWVARQLAEIESRGVSPVPAFSA